MPDLDGQNPMTLGQWLSDCGTETKNNLTLFKMD